MYIIESKVCCLTSNPKISSHINAVAHSKKASNVTTLLLETVPLVPSDNMLCNQFIYSSGCGAGAGAGLPPKPVTTCG